MGMNPLDVMLWALAALVIVVCAALAVSFVAGIIRSLTRPKKTGAGNAEIQVFDGRRDR